MDHPWTGEREGSTRSCLQPFASFGGVKLLPPCFSSKGFGPWLSHLEITSKTPANNFITSSSYEATGQEPFKRRIERSEFQIDAPLTNFGGIFEDPVTVLSAISQRSQNEKGWLLHLGRFHTTIILRQSIYTGDRGACRDKPMIHCREQFASTCLGKSRASQRWTSTRPLAVPLRAVSRRLSRTAQIL